MFQHSTFTALNHFSDPQEAGECASQLLSSLLLKQPQLLGPMLPPVVAPALLQLMVHGEAPVQVR